MFCSFGSELDFVCTLAYRSSISNLTVRIDPLYSFKCIGRSVSWIVSGKPSYVWLRHSLIARCGLTLIFCAFKVPICDVFVESVLYFTAIFRDERLDLVSGTLVLFSLPQSITFYLNSPVSGFQCKWSNVLGLRFYSHTNGRWSLFFDSIHSIFHFLKNDKQRAGFSLLGSLCYPLWEVKQFEDHLFISTYLISALSMNQTVRKSSC